MNRIKRKLLKEVRKIKNRMTKGDWIFGVYDDYLNAKSYFVIMKNGTAFYILPGCYRIPNFRFKDVAYIRKELTACSGCNYIDNYYGYYNLTYLESSKREYGMMKKFNVDKILKFDDWD